jgi:hypothetical protein
MALLQETDPMLMRTEADLRECRRTWRAFHVLAVMTELGLFDNLAAGKSLTPEVLAERLGADARAVAICAEVLAACGLLIREQGAYRQSSAADCVLPAVRELLHETHHLPHLAVVLRSGRPLVPTSGGVLPGAEEANFQFLAGLHRRSQDHVPEVVRVVRQAWHGQPGHTSGGPRILDLGGGHGCFAAALADQISGSEVTLFDREPVLAIARRLSGDQFAARAGDFLTDPLGGPYDVVLLSNVLHSEKPETCRQLLERVRAVTADAGAVVIRDRFLHDEAGGPDYAADFGVTLLFGTEHGRPRSVEECRALLSGVGFPRVSYYEVEVEEYGFVIGQGTWY